jgi:YidC/Oxa1 family membrane protein insertase
MFIDWFVELLTFVNNFVGNNLGLAIIVVTLLIKVCLIAFSYKSIKNAEKMRAMQSELQGLRKKHGDDKKAMQEAQLELYKKYNLNPLAGCIPQIIQLALLLLFFQALMRFVDIPDINSYFFGLDLTCSRSDMAAYLSGNAEDGVYCVGVQQVWPYFIIPVVAMLVQFVFSLMVLPGGEVRDIVPNNSKKKSIQLANKKEEDVASMAGTMQKQMMFMMPIMSGFIALTLPQGVGLYWVVSTIFGIIQQFLISGPGGLKIYYERLKLKFSANKAA